jgi:hypothetical protein
MNQVDEAGSLTYTEQIRFYSFVSARIRSSRNRLFPFLSPPKADDNDYEPIPPTTRFMSAPRGSVDVA